MSKLQQEAAEHMARQQYSEAIKLYEQSVEAEPTVVSNYWYLGLAFLLEGQEAKAQDTWLSGMSSGTPMQVKAWTTEIVEVLITEAVHQESLSNFKLACFIRQHVFQFTPDNFNNILSIILISTKDIEIFSSYGQLALIQANGLVLSDKYTEVNSELLIQVLSKLIDINPFHDFVGLCLITKLGIVKHEHLFELQNKLASAYNTLGFVLSQQKSFESAENCFRKALHLQHNPSKSQFTTVQFNLGDARTGTPQKVKKIVGNSQDVMRSLPLQFYDIVYIDGSHLASDVLADAVISWGLVKFGGVIIFDDYDFVFAQQQEQNTKIGIDAFLTSFCNKINIIYKSHQIIIEKKSSGANQLFKNISTISI